MNHLNKLILKESFEGLPKLKFMKDGLCDSCKKGKQSRVSFKAKNMISTFTLLELLHLDLFGTSRTMSIGENYYTLVIVNNYSRFTWTLFLSLKNNAFKAFCKLAKLIQNEKDLKIKALRSDHGGKFQNEKFETFCKEMVLNIIFQLQ